MKAKFQPGFKLKFKVEFKPKFKPETRARASHDEPARSSFDTKRAEGERSVARAEREPREPKASAW